MPPLLLTPGPLTTSDRTRAALNRDWGSRDDDFVTMSESVRRQLAAIAGVADSHEAVPIQGSGTFAVEAAIQTLVPRDGHLLVLVNGAYGRRALDIARRAGRACTAVEVAEDQPVLATDVRSALAANPAVTDVFLVHCETTTGLLNPLADIAACVAAQGKRLLVDAMSAFGAIPIDGAVTPFTALMGSANKGLEGVPGLAFVIVEKPHLSRCGGHSGSVSLDLYDNGGASRATGNGVHSAGTSGGGVVQRTDAIGGGGRRGGRHQRYCANRDVLMAGMANVVSRRSSIPRCRRR